VVCAGRGSWMPVMTSPYTLYPYRVW